MTPLLRTTLTGIVDCVTDTQVKLIVEVESDLLEQSYPRTAFEQLPKAGDKVTIKVLLGVEEPAAPPQPMVPKISTPVHVPIPASVMMDRRQRGLMDDDDADILDNPGLGGE
jgi:hypothetical protein